MHTPIIGITAHFVPGSTPRSAIVQTYVEAVLGAGGVPVAIPVRLDQDSLESVLQMLDGLLLPGGDDVSPESYNHQRHSKLGTVDRERDHLEVTAARWALDHNLPLLGICRGVQVMAVAGGGSLYQDIPSELTAAGMHDVREFGFDHLSHLVAIVPGTHLHEAVGTARTRVNSFHHQAVRDVPEGFIVSARADDGVVEGIESSSHPYAVGVQCHPEGIWKTTAPEFHNLFKGFIDAARRTEFMRTA